MATLSSKQEHDRDRQVMIPNSAQSHKTANNQEAYLMERDKDPL